MTQERTEPMRDLLPFLDTKLNNLMFSLYRNRQTLLDVQQRIGTDAALLGRVGEALAFVREQERVLADIQQHLDMVRRRG